MSNSNAPSPRRSDPSTVHHSPTPATSEPEYQTGKGCLLITLAFVAAAIITILGMALSRGIS